MNQEVWKDIPGYEGFYQVSDLGNVRSVDRLVRTVSKTGTEKTRTVVGKILRLQKHTGGLYKTVSLRVEGASKSKTVHSLVALAFIGPKPTGKEVRHIDGNGCNNNLSNLAYGTPAENAEDRRRHGTVAQGEKSPVAKLTNEDIASIRAQGKDRSQREIALGFGISQQHVSKIVRRVRWASV